MVQIYPEGLVYISTIHVGNSPGNSFPGGHFSEISLDSKGNVHLFAFSVKSRNVVYFSFSEFTIKLDACQAGPPSSTMELYNKHTKLLQ